MRKPMRKMLVLLALSILTLSTTGCTRCRNLFRRGSPCGGTALAAPAMLGGAIPLGNPVAVPQSPQIVPQNIMTQPGVCCEGAAPMCCEPCPTNCCPDGYIGGGASYGGDCGCEGSTGEYFGGYLEGSAPPMDGSVIEGGSVYPQGTSLPGGTDSQGSGTYPTPTN